MDWTLKMENCINTIIRITILKIFVLSLCLFAGCSDTKKVEVLTATNQEFSSAWMNDKDDNINFTVFYYFDGNCLICLSRIIKLCEIFKNDFPYAKYYLISNSPLSTESTLITENLNIKSKILIDKVDISLNFNFLADINQVYVVDNSNAVLLQGDPLADYRFKIKMKQLYSVKAREVKKSRSKS